MVNKIHIKTFLYIRSTIALGCIAVAIYFMITRDVSVFAGVGFMSAAIVVALQNYVSSFFSYMYIISSRQFEEGDIIRTGNPFMTANGVVRTIGMFFTTIKEVDDELMFTGKTISFPNNLIFSGGIFNYTKNDLTFWHEFTIGLVVIGDAHAAYDTFTQIVTHSYHESLLDHNYYDIHSSATSSTPKFDLTINEKGLECKVRLLVNFYKVLETNNMLMCTLLNAHKAGTITLLNHKDYPNQTFDRG